MFRVKNLIKNSSIVGIATLISRTFGYVREILLASWLGTSALSDAYTITTRIPALLRRIATEGSLNSVLIPILNRLDFEKKHRSKSVLLTKLMITLSLLFIGIFMFSVIFPKSYLLLLAPGFLKAPERLFWFLKLSPFMTFTIIFFFLGAIFSAVLNNRNQYFWPAIAPAFWNISLIVLVSWGMKFELTPWLIAPFFMIASIVQMVVTLIPYARLKIPLIIKHDEESTHEVKNFFERFVPVIFSTSISQITSFLTIFLSSFLPEGNTTLMHRAERFFQLPLSMIGALSTPLLPELTKNPENKVKIRRLSLLLTAIIFIPFSFVLYFYGRPLISLIFGYGKCTEQDINMIVRLVKIYSLGIPAFLLIKILPLFFFAEGEVKIPTKAAIVNTVIDGILSIVLMQPFGAFGLVGAPVISAWVHVCFLSFYTIKKRYLVNE